MKRSYKRLLIYELVIFFILILNSFILNILNGYGIVIFLLILLLLFKFILGFEKDRHRYTKDILFDVIIVILVSFLLYYLLGLLIGFYRARNYYNLYGLINFILPICLTIILKEVLRYQVANKIEKNNFLLALTVIIFVFLDISTNLYYKDLASSHDIFMFISLVLFPSISNNIVSTYICKKIGYLPNILWLIVINLYTYLIPIIPNPNEYVLSIIKFIFPFIIAYKVYFFFEKEEDKQAHIRKRRKNYVSIFISFIIISVLVYFVSGYFKHYAVAIASGSMAPVLNRGDVVIIEKIDDNFSDIKEGDVIAYKYGNVIVVHRVIRYIKNDDENYFYTKGDANEIEDNYMVSDDMIIGIVKVKVPYIGFPTIWFSEL